MDKEIHQTMIAFCRSLMKMLGLTSLAFRKANEESIKEAEEKRKEVRRNSSEMTKLLVTKGTTGQGKDWLKPFLSIVSHFDRIGYNLDGILDRVKKMTHEQILFTERAIHEIEDIFQEVEDLLANLPDLLLTQNRLLSQKIEEKGKLVFKKVDNYSEENEERLIQGVCVPQSFPVYLDILFSLKGIVIHIVEVCEVIAALSTQAREGNR